LNIQIRNFARNSPRTRHRREGAGRGGAEGRRPRTADKARGRKGAGPRDLAPTAPLPGPETLRGPHVFFIFFSSTCLRQKCTKRKVRNKSTPPPSTPRTQESRHKAQKTAQNDDFPELAPDSTVRINKRFLSRPETRERSCLYDSFPNAHYCMRAWRQFQKMKEIARLGRSAHFLRCRRPLWPVGAPFKSPRFSLCANKGAQRALGPPPPPPPGALPAPDPVMRSSALVHCARGRLVLERFSGSKAGLGGSAPPRLTLNFRLSGTSPRVLE